MASKLQFHRWQQDYLTFKHFHSVLVIGVAVSLPFSIKLGSICIILLCANWLFEGGFREKLHALQKKPALLIWPALFSIHVLSAWLSANQDNALFEIEKKLSLLALPIVLGSSMHTNERLLRNTCRWFTLSTLLVGCYCLVIAGLAFLEEGTTHHFFYHDLLTPVGGHAVYFSMYLLCALWLIIGAFLSKKTLIFNLRWTAFISALATLLLLLLASKLMLVLFALSIAAWFFWAWRKNINPTIIGTISVGGLGTLALLTLTNNPISSRFEAVMEGNRSILSQERYSYDTPFNGLSLRLVQLKLGWYILQEDQQWIWGVGLGDAQDELNKQYAKHGVYLGNPDLGDDGYSNANFHNQYMQTWIQSGLLGLLLLITALFHALHNGLRSASYDKLGLLLIWISFFCTESMLETHKGLVIMMLLIPFLLDRKEKQKV